MSDATALTGPGARHADAGPETPLETLLTSSRTKKLAKKLADELNIRTAKQLLDHLPRRYVQHGQLDAFTDLVEGEQVAFSARVVSTNSRSLRSRKGIIVDVTVEDSHGNTLALGFFNGWRARNELRPGMEAIFAGKVGRYKNRLTLNNPDYQIVMWADQLTIVHRADEKEEAAHEIMPLYPATAKLPTWSIRDCVQEVLPQTRFTDWPSAVSAPVQREQRLPSLAEAYLWAHVPQTLKQADHARRRFRFAEALVVQGLMARRRHQIQQVPARAAPPRSDGVLSELDARLPFELTEGQRRAGELIAADLAQQHPMNRLLQGEVGSGKTLVALRAMLQVVDAGMQAAMVAPTEVLAIQHERSLRRTLGDLAAETSADEGVRIALLTGSMPTAQRKQVLLDIASGQTDIVVGTHAVLGQTVQFAELGLAVIDEQHRFGVAQRNALRSKFVPTPHALVMSATPIPRSVAMTVFGDLELTLLEGLPQGRSPTETHLVPMARGPAWILRVWDRIAEEAAAGRQTFVVCPRITQTNDDDGPGFRQRLAERFGSPDLNGEDFDVQQAQVHAGEDASVELMETKLREQPALAGLRIATAHGQQPPGELAATMAAFEAGEIDVLISTTVIEVGVDVPNATLMVVLDADAFGISTLHQLRGRIGRGRTHKNQCLLVTRLPEDHPAVVRLRDVAATSDGMHLARLDLARRREGDVLSSLQAGRRSSLQHLRVTEHEEDIVAAGEWIQTLTAEDPEWRQHPGLRAAVAEFQEHNDDAEHYIQRG